MATNRNDLKQYFNAGDRPTEAQFADLIDSTININEDKATDVEAENPTIDNKYITPKTAKKAVEKHAVIKVANTTPTNGNIDLKTINNSSIVGSGNLDLATQTELNSLQASLNNAQTLLNTLQSTIISLQDNKVDKITGKGLSSNDFTNTYKSKIDSLRLAITAPSLADPTTVNETVVAKWTIPANFISTGMSFLCNASYISGISSTVIWRVRIGTTGTIGDSLAATLATSAAQAVNARGSVNFNVYTPSATSIRSSGFAVMTNAMLGTVTGVNTDVTINSTSVLYISITATVSVANTNNKILGAGIFVNS